MAGIVHSDIARTKISIVKRLSKAIISDKSCDDVHKIVIKKQFHLNDVYAIRFGDL